MDVPEEFITELIKKSVSFPLFLFTHDISNEKNFKKIIETEELSAVLTLLKYKLIQINRNKAIPLHFDVEKLYHRVPEYNFSLLHDILFHSLIIQPCNIITFTFLSNSCNFLRHNVKDKSRNIILHHLEIIDVILELFMLCNENALKEIEDGNNLCMSIINLITCDDNDIRRKIITDVIPKYITYSNNYDLFFNLWENIKNCSFKTYILLALEKYFIPEHYNENYFNILNINEFWLHLQENICSVDSAIKKQSYHLLKKSIETLFHNESYATLIPKCNIIKWDIKNFDAHKNAWKFFFILYEVSNEKQIHLIEPAFKLYNSLKPLHFTWRNSVTNLFINHPHSAVLKYSVINILKREWPSNINLLVQGLNNNFLYENCSESDFLKHLSSYISLLNQEEFLTFINEILNSRMSPVPFYYICKIISSSDVKDIEFKILIDILKFTEKVPHLYIRTGITHYLFLYFVKMLEHCKQIDKNFVDDFAKIVYLLHCNNYLQRGNLSWQQLLKIILINININETFHNLKFTKEFCVLSKDYSVLIAILIDSEILSKNWIQNYLHNIFKINYNICKLDCCTFLCNIINVMCNPDEVFEEIFFSHEDIKNIFNELFTVCNEINSNFYNIKFFDNIEFILDIVLYRIFLNNDCCSHFIIFLEKLQKENKLLCYLILSKKLVQAYELNINKISHEDLINLSVNLKNVKKKFSVEQKNITEESSIKQKLFQNLYYSKLNLKKLLVMKFRTNFKNQTEECDNLLEKINKYYDKGGLDIIISVIDTLHTIIKHCYFHNMPPNFIVDFLNLLQRCEKDIFNLRSNELFRPAIIKFICTIIHPQMFQHEMLKDYVHIICLNMFDSSQITTGIRNEILNRIHLQNLSPDILVEGLLFGQILRRDQRIEFETCNMISQDINHLNFDLTNPCQLDGRVRSKSVSILLSLIYKPYHNFNVKHFCENILKLLFKKYNETAGKRYFGDSQIHLVKLRILQSLHLIAPKLKKETLKTLVEWLFDCIVNESQQPSIKIFIQWLMTRIFDLLKNKELILNKLISEIKILKGTSCTSIFPLLYFIVKDKTVNINIVYECMEFLLPYTMGQQFNIRFSAQVAIQHIYETYSSIPEFSIKYLSLYKSVTEVLNQTATDKLHDNVLTYCNILPSIQNIYYDIPRLTHVTKVEWLPVEYFTGIISMKLRSNDELSKIETTVLRRTENIISESDNDNMNVQKKIDTYDINLINSTLVKNNLGNLIVVACLIDKAPNLGGLSRTCEVFGIRQYVLNNIQFLKNKEYQSLSMSSEKWIDTLEVKADNLSSYLLEMKKKNYQIVGAEQTADSKTLNTFKFDKNTVLLLGNEKEGIPPNLIHLLDECIEIPQFGQIRSLNVHVAGALFIWEYIKQHHVTE